MTSPVAVESAWADRLRLWFRAYRYAPLSPGHGVVRRLFRGLIGRHQRVTLRNGIRLELDLGSEVQQNLFWYDGDLEPQLEWAIRELLPVGAPCVDCGANCGYIGLYARRFRGSPVWFVEPHPRLAATVRRNVALNGFDADCTVIEAAASDLDGEAVLYEHREKDGSHSLIPGWSQPDTAGPANGITVPIGTLPSLLGRSAPDHIGLLKVDAEGHDSAVLRGLGDRLRPNRIGMIYAELGRERSEAFDRLESAGYTGFGQPEMSRRELRRRLRASQEGRPAVIFQPLVAGRAVDSETLWLPRGGPAARHLAALARMTSGD